MTSHPLWSFEELDRSPVLTRSVGAASVRSSVRMLYAEIHGKLVPEALEHERAEDILTSTVWGTLLLAGGWRVIGAWLERARDLEGRALELTGWSGDEGQYWFWPQLRDAEPDLVLRLGPQLVVVEAKYLSDKSGVGRDDEGRLQDQLARQWRSVEAAAKDGAGCSAELREAVQAVQAKSIVYLVRARSAAKARAEVEASLQLLRPAEARLFVLRWEDLDAVLLQSEAMHWRDALRQVLSRRGLRAFVGFPSIWTRATAHAWSASVVRRLRPGPWTPRFVRCVTADRATIARLRPRLGAPAVSGLRASLASLDVRSVRRMIAGRVLCPRKT